MSSIVENPQRSTGSGLADIAKRIFIRFGILPLLLLVVIIFFGLQEPRFLSQINIFNVMRQSTFLMIVAMGQMFVLIAAGMDLSIGATIGLVTIVTAKLMLYLTGIHGLEIYLAIPLSIISGLAVALVVGVVNGVCVAWLRLSPFMATLGTMTSVMGVSLTVSRGLPVAGLPNQYSMLLSVESFFGMQAPIIATILLFFLGLLLMRRTTIGRYIYAVGSNARAARLSGINTVKIRFVTYLLSSLFAGVAGVLILARTGTGSASLGSDYALQSVAACVIAGVSLFGGIGKIGGVVLGALFLTLLGNGMNILQVQSYAQMIVIGAILIIALLADQIRLRVVGQQRLD